MVCPSLNTQKLSETSRQTLPRPNRGHLFLKVLGRDGEHTSFVSLIRSCRWHPGSLNSARVPELLQPVCSSALLNPWISVCSEVGRRFLVCPQEKATLPWLNYCAWASRAPKCFVWWKTHSVGQMPQPTVRGWNNLSCWSLLEGAPFHLSWLCKSTRATWLLWDGAPRWVRMGTHVLPFLGCGVARSTAITGQRKSNLERKRPWLPNLDTQMPVWGLELIQLDFLLAVRASCQMLTAELLLWLVQGQTSPLLRRDEPNEPAEGKTLAWTWHLLFRKYFNRCFIFLQFTSD